MFIDSSADKCNIRPRIDKSTGVNGSQWIAPCADQFTKNGFFDWSKDGIPLSAWLSVDYVVQRIETQRQNTKRNPSQDPKFAFWQLKRSPSQIQNLHFGNRKEVLLRVQNLHFGNSFTLFYSDIGVHSTDQHVTETCVLQLLTLNHDAKCPRWRNNRARRR